MKKRYKTSGLWLFCGETDGFKIILDLRGIRLSESADTADAIGHTAQKSTQTTNQKDCQTCHFLSKTGFGCCK